MALQNRRVASCGLANGTATVQQPRYLIITDIA
jgi:hypothetical protein